MGKSVEQTWLYEFDVSQSAHLAQSKFIMHQFSHTPMGWGGGGLRNATMILKRIQLLSSVVTSLDVCVLKWQAPRFYLQARSFQ